MTKGLATFLIVCGVLLVFAGVGLVILHIFVRVDLLGLILGALLAVIGIGIAILAARERRRPKS
jgi:hypothetical protein